MNRIFSYCLLSFLLVLSSWNHTQAQDKEVGIWLGVSNYFGDLNVDYSFKSVRPGGGIFYRWNATPYIALKGAANYGMLAFDDADSKNPYQQVRNLSFKSNIIELAFQVEFNFIRYVPGKSKNAYSPYLTIGVSMFHFKPKAEYQGEWYDLQQVGTEGQGNPDLSNLKPYRTVQPAIPIGLGFKYWMKKNWTFNVEVGYRATFTDYIDDVSGTYIDENILGPGSIAAIIGDRSDEVTNPPIGEHGRQRGDKVSKDGFVFIGVGLSYTIFDVKCPGSRRLLQYQ